MGWSRADQTEALIIAQDISLVRFCKSAINQNVSEKRGTLFIRVVMGRRIGSASTHRFDDQAIQRGLERATERAQFQPPTESLKLLPWPKSLQPITSIYDKIARYSPPQRAEDPKGLWAISGDRTYPAVEGAHGKCTTRSSNLSQLLHRYQYAKNHRFPSMTTGRGIEEILGYVERGG